MKIFFSMYHKPNFFIFSFSKTKLSLNISSNIISATSYNLTKIFLNKFLIEIEISFSNLKSNEDGNDNI